VKEGRGTGGGKNKRNADEKKGGREKEEKGVEEINIGVRMEKKDGRGRRYWRAFRIFRLSLI